MDQGLGLKNTHPVDDLASSSDVRIAKDNSGHVYESEETERAFILTAKLKDYRKEHVKIDPSDDGTRISIVLENVMSGRSTKTKKVFRIPDGVDSTRIKAKFIELESTLTIDMPKVKKGIVGARVEEVKEERTDIGTPPITQAASDEFREKDGEKMKVVENFHAAEKEVDKEENRNEIQKSQAENPREIRESEESKTVKIKQPDGIEKKREDAKETIKEAKHGEVENDRSTEASQQVAEPSQEKHGEVENDKSTEASQQVVEPSQETEVVKEPRIEKQKTSEKKEVDEYCESPKMGKGKDVGGKSTPEKKPAATEKFNPLRTPLIIVGSALLVSIVLLSINRIRNRKRWI